LANLAGGDSDASLGVRSRVGTGGATALAPLMAFTPWMTIAAVFVVGIAVALENWAAAIVAALSLPVLAAGVLPRAFGSGEAVPGEAEALTVLSANVYRGHADPNALVDLVKQLHPDLLAIQELRPRFVRRLDEAGIRRLLPHSDLLVHARDVPGGRPGIGVYSMLPINPIAHGARSSMLPMELTLSTGERIRFATVHPVTPSVEGVDLWARALERIPSAGVGAPWLLAGDFNATLDQSAPRDVIDRGYRDAGGVTGSGLEMTWTNDTTLPPLVAIDHVLADERLGISGYGVDDLRGSDHRAIWAEVFVKPSDVVSGAR
jgi:endonuclease/exonuclease/phosphatase (EEP) superfamily protein YafD